MKRRRGKSTKINRREFFKKSAIGGLSLPLISFSPHDRGRKNQPVEPKSLPLPATSNPSQGALDLAPARWIWYPSARTLCNTVVLFRRGLKLSGSVKKASGWIVADSRYRLFVNGHRVQWGPAPSDPRTMEVDPVDLTQILHEGENVIAAEVLYYGLGDGTWPIGKPGFIFLLYLLYADGRTERVISDNSWNCCLPRSWKPGQYKRWYLRALQEEFDARLYPYGWMDANFEQTSEWLSAMVLDCPANKPAMCASYPEYAMEIRGSGEVSELRPRSVPFMKETTVPIKRLAESLWIKWLRDPADYFDCVTPDCFEIERTACASEAGDETWKVDLDGQRAAALTFEFEEQIVGWPFFTIEAPAGTIIELMVQEAHALGGPPLLNTQFFAWTRFICREGINRFETFDFESCRWMQLHIRGAHGEVTVKDVGLRRRMFPWQHGPEISCSEPSLQRLFDASVNTLNNSAQEIAVDGMARERQQYSGDGGHQLHGIQYAFGETRLPARFISTFTQGLTLDGYFLDCWPAYDRLARLMERQLQLTSWGPLLDHGVGFNFDCWFYYLYTGDLEPIRESYPRLLKFFQYLKSIRGEDGLLPVENIGVPSVWIDHDAYLKQRHKRCPFNLYAAAMMRNALAPLCSAFGEVRWAREVNRTSDEILKSTIRSFWQERKRLFIDNLPWLSEEKSIRLSDRSLATAVLYDQCPRGVTSPSLKVLADTPPEMGFSYPANAGWRLWALAKGGRQDIILKDLRERWAQLDSVRLNNTLQEAWTVQPDSTSQWSHCAVVPLYILYMGIAGIRPLLPGYRRYEVIPRFGDLEQIGLTANTVQGPITINSRGRLGEREISIQTPKGGEGEIALDSRENVELGGLKRESGAKLSRYRLPAGSKVILNLKFT